MWYFAWILGGALAASFAILNALWFEVDPRRYPEKPDED